MPPDRGHLCARKRPPCATQSEQKRLDGLPLRERAGGEGEGGRERVGEPEQGREIGRDGGMKGRGEGKRAAEGSKRKERSVEEEG